tara:strand:- start:4925 stop:5206 length:282 start_codon:yes stop_codon:yes gene_type:complete
MHDIVWKKGNPSKNGWYFTSYGLTHSWTSWRYWSKGKWSKPCSIAESDKFASIRSEQKTEDELSWSDYLHPKAKGDRSNMFNIGAPMYAAQYR